MSENSEQFDDIVDNLKQASAWIRILFMLGFAVVLYFILAPVILILMIAQALFSVTTGSNNANLRYLGAAIGQYVNQILAFLSFNSDEKPFPFSEFPKIEEPAAAAVVDDAGVKTDANGGKADPETVAEKPVAKKSSRKKQAAKKAARKKTSSTTASSTPASSTTASSTKTSSNKANNNDVPGDTIVDQ